MPSIAGHIVQVSQHIEVLHLPDILIGLQESLFICIRITAPFKELLIVRIPGTNQMDGSNHEIKRILPHILQVIGTKMRLQSDLHTDPHRNPSPVLLLQYPHPVKIFLHVEGPLVPFTYIVLILMVRKTDRI